LGFVLVYLFALVLVSALAMAGRALAEQGSAAQMVTPTPATITAIPVRSVILSAPATPASPVKVTGSLDLTFTLDGLDPAISMGACPKSPSDSTRSQSSITAACAMTANRLSAIAYAADGSPEISLVVIPSTDQILLLDASGAPLIGTDGDMLNVPVIHGGILRSEVGDLYFYRLHLDYWVRADGSSDLDASVCGQNAAGNIQVAAAIPSGWHDWQHSTLTAPVAFGISGFSGAPFAAAAATLNEGNPAGVPGNCGSFGQGS
jgi:hypothetical protein